MKTTFGRNFVTHAVILLSALLLVGVSFQLLVKDYLSGRMVEELKNDSATVAQVAAAYYTDSGLTGRDFLINLSVAARVSQADAVICDARGRLVLCSDSPLGCEHQGLTITNSGYLQRVHTQDYVVTTGIVEGLYAEQRYIVSAPIKDTNGTVLGFVMVSAPTADTLSVLERLTDTYILVSVLVVLAAVVVMTVYARKTSIPLRNMAKAANAFGHGDLKARVAVSQDSPEEIRELALAFNNMAASLEKSEYQRKEFVANVSHELKTPMTTISGYVDGMLDGTIPPQQQERFLRIVSDETKRLSRLVRSMLDISRLQENQQIPEEKKTRFDVCEAVGRVLITFEKQITDKNLEVEVDMPSFPVYTHADQDAITQVVYNLTDNAVKFCPQGGTLGVTVRTGTDKIYVSIANTGPTIPPEELPLVFDRFHKLDKSRTQNRDGWGLGLYIVKTLVCGHGENISVSSREEKTEFTFTLPIVN